MNINTKVRQLLEAKPALRNDDMKLILAVWMTEGLKLEPEQIDYILDKCSSAESIRRNRQKIQEKGELQASESVQNNRKAKEQRYKNGGYTEEVSHSGYEVDYQNGVVYRV